MYGRTVRVVVCFLSPKADVFSFPVKQTILQENKIIDCVNKSNTQSLPNIVPIRAEFQDMHVVVKGNSAIKFPPVCKKNIFTNTKECQIKLLYTCSL